MINGKKVIVVMPAYNAEQTLERTVAEIPDSVDEVILVDDGSRDGTAELARRLGLRTLVHPQNRGYGGNQKTCYQEALRRGADIVVMVHPDYQYTPKLVPALAHCVASGLFDIAMGSRILGGRSLQGGMPRYKYLANRILTLAENLLLGEKLSEYHTGYRAFSRRVLLSLPLQENHDGFVFDNQMLVQAVQFGFQIAEVTCPTRYFEEASSIGFLKSVEYGLGVLGAAVQFRLAKLGAVHPAFLSEQGRKLQDPRQDPRQDSRQDPSAESSLFPGRANLRRKEDQPAAVPAGAMANVGAQDGTGDEAGGSIAPERTNVDSVSYH